ncbi:hypothetical protein FXO37_27142 [Capsicum annuum]|nr:hypothetical protein FXO37_27142 [Capsicum annuum]
MKTFNYESVGFDENRSKHRNNPHTMKKSRQNHVKKDKKKECHGCKKRGSNSSASKASAKRRRIVEVIFRDELPKVKQVVENGQGVPGFGRKIGDLFKHAITAGKRVRTDTNISNGSVSVSSAVVELIETSKDMMKFFFRPYVANITLGIP